jgi:hypothetical protein
MKDGLNVVNGENHWYLNGKKHREDGPAVEYPDGDKHWYIDNKQYSLNNWLNNHPTMTIEEKILFKLTWG